MNGPQIGIVPQSAGRSVVSVGDNFVPAPRRIVQRFQHVNGHLGQVHLDEVLVDSDGFPYGHGVIEIQQECLSVHFVDEIHVVSGTAEDVAHDLTRQLFVCGRRFRCLYGNRFPIIIETFNSSSIAIKRESDLLESRLGCAESWSVFSFSWLEFDCCCVTLDDIDSGCFFT